MEKVTGVDLVLLLDESASMAHQREDIVFSVNDLIGAQRTGAGELLPVTKLHIYKFNTKVGSPVSHPLATFPPFERRHYSPCGGTALFDAIAAVCSEFTDTSRRVVLIIATDGEDNQSETSFATVSTLIKERQEAGWSVIYLSENMEAWKQGANMGCSATSCVYTKKKKLCTAFRDKDMCSAISNAVHDDRESMSLNLRTYAAKD